LYESSSRVVLVAALGVEQPEAVAWGGPPGGAVDGDLVLLRRPRVLPHRAELFGDFRVSRRVVRVDLLDAGERLVRLFLQKLQGVRPREQSERFEVLRLAA
jgi:hypothetical protein